MRSNKLNIKLIVVLFTLGFSMGISSVVAIEFDPTPNPPYENAYWDLNIGDIFWWNLTLYNGTEMIKATDFAMKINDTTYRDDHYQALGLPFYSVQGEMMEYNESTENFDGTSITLYVSLISFNQTNMFCGDTPEINILFFIPKTGSTLLTEFCAESASHDFPYILNRLFSVTSNSIRYYNTEQGSNIRMVFCDDGTLFSAIYFVPDMIPYWGGDKWVVERLYPECTPSNGKPEISFGTSYLIFTSIITLLTIIYVFKKVKY
jgi:hypothetical protein